jgi:hypothetical protein
MGLHEFEIMTAMCNSVNIPKPNQYKLLDHKPAERQSVGNFM